MARVKALSLIKFPSRHWAVLCGLWCALSVCAQGGPTDETWLVGIGRLRQQDTYLSPLHYRGPQLTFVRETFHPTRRCQQRIVFQSYLQGAFSYTENKPGTANEWGGRLGYNAGWHYQWTPLSGLRLMAGALVGTRLGIVYNDQGGNNPAQGRAAIDVSASVLASYHFRLGRKTLGVRYQALLPLAGCMFSPQYGQSYYELSEGNRDHNIVFTQPFCAPSLWQLLSIDIPFRRYTLRTGYLSDIRQSHVNGIKSHDISRSFMLGFVKRFSLLSPKTMD